MVCDTTWSYEGQTLTERKREIVSTVQAIDKLVSSNRVKPVVDRNTGAVTFAYLRDSDRNGLTDACVYRRLVATGSAATRVALQRAEQAAGRPVNRQSLAAGIHSHDGGRSWSGGH